MPTVMDRHSAMKKTEKIFMVRCNLEYEINTLYTSQGQTPFNTLDSNESLNVVFENILQVQKERISKEKRDFQKLVSHIETRRRVSMIQTMT